MPYSVKPSLVECYWALDTVKVGLPEYQRRNGLKYAEGKQKKNQKKKSVSIL